MAGTAILSIFFLLEYIFIPLVDDNLIDAICSEGAKSGAHFLL